MRISDWSSDVCSSDLIVMPVRNGVLSRRTFDFDGIVEQPGNLSCKRHIADRLPCDDVQKPLAAVQNDFETERRDILDVDVVARFLAVAEQRDLSGDRKSTRLNSSHYCATRMPSSA